MHRVLPPGEGARAETHPAVPLLQDARVLRPIQGQENRLRTRHRGGGRSLRRRRARAVPRRPASPRASARRRAEERRARRRIRRRPVPRSVPRPVPRPFLLPRVRIVVIRPLGRRFRLFHLRSRRMGGRIRRDDPPETKPRGASSRSAAVEPLRAALAPSERPVAMARRGGGTARPYPRPTRTRSIRVGVERQLVGRGSSSSRSDVVSARRGRTFIRRGISRGGGRTRGGARGVSSSRTSRGARASTGPRRGTRGRVGSGVPPEDPGLRSPRTSWTIPPRGRRSSLRGTWTSRT